MPDEITGQQEGAAPAEIIAASAGPDALSEGLRAVGSHPVDPGVENCEALSLRSNLASAPERGPSIFSLRRGSSLTPTSGDRSTPARATSSPALSTTRSR